MRGRGLIVVLGVSCLISGVAASSSAARWGSEPIARAAACPDVLLLGSRGSGESSASRYKGMGEPLFTMASRLSRKL